MFDSQRHPSDLQGHTMHAATLLSITAISLTLLNLGWSIQSWRHTGPRMKVRALINGNTLRLTFANGGRSPDAITHVFLGGSRVGHGKDLTGHLAVPVKIEAASPAEYDIELDTDEDAALLRRARHGFESVHICLGSLHTLRSDVLPHSQLGAAASWQLVRRPGAVRRFGPFAAALLAYLVAAVPASYAQVGRLAVGLVILSSFVAWYAGQFRRQRFSRARLERALTATGLIAAFAVVGSGTGSSGGTVPAISSYGLLTLVGAGGLLAEPTAVAGLLAAGRCLHLGLRHYSSSLARHVREG
jgi:hypothetical protein